MQGGLFGHDDDYRSELLKEFGFKEEVAQIWPYRYQDSKTGFPEPMKTYHITWEVPDLTIEEPYFWYLQEVQYTFPIIEKLEDAFSASEHSAVFGVTQQRLGAQQDKVSQFLATTGKMIKELFQMVRELRIIDERMAYYEESNGELSKEVKKRGRSAEITLKGIFIDLVQGGGKSAASVYGLARELEFITLPDLFFDAPPFKNTNELEAHMKSLEESFNRNLTRVLQRHLRQFMEWKKRTHIEHKNRRRFMLQYLLQHFEIIKMYINWVKPYLRHVARMTLKDRNMSAPDVIAAFEGSIIDIEFLARKPNGRWNGCILASFRYRTRAEMKVVQEGYQRGPVHVGKFEMQLRTYAWTDKQVENYKKLKEIRRRSLRGVNKDPKPNIHIDSSVQNLRLYTDTDSVLKGIERILESMVNNTSSGDIYIQKSNCTLNYKGSDYSGLSINISDSYEREAPTINEQAHRDSLFNGKLRYAAAALNGLCNWYITARFQDEEWKRLYVWNSDDITVPQDKPSGFTHELQFIKK